MVDAADILVVCRARYSDRINAMITRAKNLGREVIFDVDDLVVDPSYTHLLLHSLDLDLSNEATWDFWFSYTARVGATMRMCDRVIASWCAETSDSAFGLFWPICSPSDSAEAGASAT